MTQEKLTLDDRLFTAQGPDFYQLRQRLLEQYKAPAYDPATGLDPQQLDAEFSAILEAPGLSRMDCKSQLLALVMTKARLHIDPADWFADHFEGRGLLRRLQEQWRREVKQGPLAETGRLLDKGRATGYFDAELDLGHTAAGWRVLFKNGITGLLQNARRARAAQQCSEAQNAFYDGVERVLTAFRAMVLRFAALAQQQAAQAGEFQGRSAALAACLRHIADNPPETLYQALQLSYLYHQMVEYEGENLRSMASFERNFSPFYERDLAEGRITRGDAAELIRFYWMKFFAHTKGKDNGKNFYFGGQSAPGQDNCTELTYLALDVFYELQQTDPKFSIRFHKNSPQRLYNAVATCIRDGRTGMVLVNDEVAIPALLKMGKDPAEVYDYLLIGCYEPTIEGREIACNMSIKVNLAKPVELVLNRGADSLTGEALGPDTGALEALDSYEAFYAAYLTQLRSQVDQVTGAIKDFELYWGQINPSPLLASTLVDCIESGRDISDGGPKYNNTGCMGGCLASAADSLMAIKQLVYDEKLVTLDQLRQVLKDDWQGSEQLQATAKNRVEKWGNNRPTVDGIARSIADEYTTMVNRRPNNRGGVFAASMFSLDHNVSLGRRTGALPDGRNAGAYLSRGIGAMTAMDKAGVTAHIQSATKLDYTSIPNGSVLDIYLHPSAVMGEQGLQALIGLIKTYFAKGGFGIQFNILDAEDLRRAQVEPEKYATLQVRLCGWNVYFVTLSAEMQQQLIDSLMQVL